MRLGIDAEPLLRKAYRARLSKMGNKRLFNYNDELACEYDGDLEYNWMPDDSHDELKRRLDKSGFLDDKGNSDVFDTYCEHRYPCPESDWEVFVQLRDRLTKSGFFLKAKSRNY